MKRKEDTRLYNELRKIDKFEIGQKIDVRDTEYIWCKALIKDIINNPNQETLIQIHYIVKFIILQFKMPKCKRHHACICFYVCTQFKNILIIIEIGLE